MNNTALIITRIIHAITGILLVLIGCYYLYWGLLPVDDNEKSLRGLMVIQGVVALVLSLIPILSFFRLKQRHSKILHYVMVVLSIALLVLILYTYFTE